MQLFWNFLEVARLCMLNIATVATFIWPNLPKQHIFSWRYRYLYVIEHLHCMLENFIFINIFPSLQKISLPKSPVKVYNSLFLNPFNTLRIPFRVPDPDYIYTMNHMKDNWNMIKYQTNLFMYILNLDFIRPLISKRALDSFIFSTNVLISI